MIASPDSTLQAAPPQWWEVLSALSPAAILAAGIVAAVVGLLTLRQRSYADARAQWWSRAQWALDSALSADHKRAEMGLRVMKVLAASELARNEEIEILTVAWEQPLAFAEGFPRVSSSALPGKKAAPSAELPPAARSATDSALKPDEHAVRIAAAQLRLVTDLRLGKLSPDWVASLAMETPRRGD